MLASEASETVFRWFESPDLVHVSPARIDGIDYGTDRGRHAESEYRKRLGVSYHVAEPCDPDRGVSTALFYTGPGERQSIDPLSLERLREIDSDALPSLRSTISPVSRLTLDDKR